MLSSGGFLQTLSRVNGLQVLFGDFGGGLDLIGDKKRSKKPSEISSEFPRSSALDAVLLFQGTAFLIISLECLQKSR